MPNLGSNNSFFIIFYETFDFTDTAAIKINQCRRGPFLALHARSPPLIFAYY